MKKAASEDRAVKVSRRALETLKKHKAASGVPMARLLDVAVDIADQEWQRKGIHIPPARV